MRDRQSGLDFRPWRRVSREAVGRAVPRPRSKARPRCHPRGPPVKSPWHLLVFGRSRVEVPAVSRRCSRSPGGALPVLGGDATRTRTTLAAVALLAVGTLLGCLTATAQPPGPAQPKPAAGIPREITTPDKEEARLVASGKGKRLGEAIHRFPLLFLVAMRINSRPKTEDKPFRPLCCPCSR